jgi:hypothetical protein
MAIVLVEVSRKSQPAGCKCGAAKVQPVAQMAATMPTATPDPGTVKAAEEWSLSYSAWLALLSVVGGIIIISQAKK